MSNTISLNYLHALFDYTRSQGVTDELLLNGELLNLENTDTRCSEEFAANLFERAAILTKDSTLGLHVGTNIRLSHFGVLGYIVMNCSTLLEAVDYLLRYQFLVIKLGSGFSITADNDSIIVSCPPDEAWPMRQLAEFNIASCVSFMRWVTGYKGSLLRIDFNYSAPPVLQEYHQIFQCELRFDQPCYRLVMPLTWLAMPLIRPDATMRAVMLSLAEKQLQALPRGDDILSCARSVIAQALSVRQVDLLWVAEKLAISTRTLQRALQTNQNTFSGLIDEVRQELAKKYLSDPTITTVDAAFLLGYSEQSAFQRAFRRWTGMTPRDYRQTQ